MGNIVIWMIAGIGTGFLAGAILPGRRFGRVADFIVSVGGALSGGEICSFFLGGGSIGSALGAVAGSCAALILLYALHATTTMPKTASRRM